MSSDNRRGLYYKGGDYYSKGGASEIEKDSCCGEGTMTMRITPGKVCKHLDSRGAGGFSLERSRHKYKDLGLDESARQHMDQRSHQSSGCSSGGSA